MHLVRELSRILRVWRKQDRIRVAPSLGSMLVFQREQQLLIRGAVYRIVQRAMTTNHETLAVTYTIAELNSSVTAQLSVSIALARPTRGSITFVRGSSTMELFLEDVSVLSTEIPAGRN